MIVETGNKDEIRHQALLEVIRVFGGIANCSRELNVSRAEIQNWCNKPKMKIPYEYVVMMHFYTRVSLTRLSSFTERANKSLGGLSDKGNASLIYKPLPKILIGDHYYLKHSKQNSKIIVGADDVLISGLAQIKRDLASGIKKRLVMVLDLEGLLLDKGSLRDRDLKLLISEQIAIGLRLEQLLGNRQGQRTDLLSSQEEANRNMSRGKTIAHLIGLPSQDTYYRAKQVYLQGNSKLIDSLDRKEISITMAAKQI